MIAFAGGPDFWRFAAPAAGVIAVVTLVVAVLLIRGQRRRRRTGWVFLSLSLLIHALLIALVPLLPGGGQGTSAEAVSDDGTASVDVAVTMWVDADQPLPMTPSLPPISLRELPEPLQKSSPSKVAADWLGEPADDPPPEIDAVPQRQTPPAGEAWMDALLAELEPANDEPDEVVPSDDSSKSDLTDADTVQSPPASVVPVDPNPVPRPSLVLGKPQPASNRPTETAATDETQNQPPTFDRTRAMAASNRRDDFSLRRGSDRNRALRQTGGDADTQAAVDAALRFLSKSQSADGSWSPRRSGGGRDRLTLGVRRPGAGSGATTALTGLSLLALLGDGNTHHDGDYADNVFRGLAYLIRTQTPDGDLSGNASLYASTYSHGMAALAMCEAAAITGDASAMACATRAVRFTTGRQHPITGGWRYIAGDPGDLSQLGWQAMVIDAGSRAGIDVGAAPVQRIERFLDSVARGRHRGLACYRNGESVSATMTAEALATRLLLRLPTTETQIAEAEKMLLADRPGVGADNYYYWYYATLGLHQLQDDAWRQWNDALKRRLLATQRSDGSWSDDTAWGGYGGQFYTTAMATLCLQTYYRHAIRNSN